VRSDPRAAQRGLAAIHACARGEEVFRGTRKTTGGTPALPKKRAANILIFEFIAAAGKTCFVNASAQLSRNDAVGKSATVWERLVW
jgi:hypothetical protein